MIRTALARLRRYFAERREAAQVPAGWDAPQMRDELARIVREHTAERAQVTPRTLPEPPPYTPRHAAGEEASPTPGYQPRRDGSQSVEDTGHLLDFPAYYRAHGRQSLRQWQAERIAEPWGFLVQYPERPTRDDRD
ncbi:hypothetical protein GA0070616_4576 [Micromonospora nigra]|uniref:Uncharacterized protein n=1 Tax=Micromonospora nigra TaxID=145857 RepID=A0A1C6SU56_9ACTN|nr:hypothetical protein [Micromonospora nigra]SCL32872.1 hypothetical protein GA0070616_4576 [Micromonospora nigra]